MKEARSWNCLSALAALKKRDMNWYGVGTVRWKPRVLSMSFSMFRICSRV